MFSKLALVACLGLSSAAAQAKYHRIGVTITVIQDSESWAPADAQPNGTVHVVRLYALFDGEGFFDEASSVFAFPGEPLDIEVIGGRFYQSSLGTDIAPLSTETEPSVLLDTFATIGSTTLNSLNDFGFDPGWPGFTDTGLSTETSGWFVFTSSGLRIPRENPAGPNSVLLGQFSVIPEQDFAGILFKSGGVQVVSEASTTFAQFSSIPNNAGLNGGSGLFVSLIQQPSPVIVNPDNGHEYWLTPELHTWQDARAEALAAGGDLVSITSQSEQDFVVNNFYTGEHLWIGATDEAEEGVWTWSTGEPFDFTAWFDGEPNNRMAPDSGGPDGEDYGALAPFFPDGRWNDAPGIRGTGNPSLFRALIEREPGCQPDTNGDGFLDTGDITTFVQLFLASDLAVDFNGDGFLDTGDITSFVAAFLAGC